MARLWKRLYSNTVHFEPNSGYDCDNHVIPPNRLVYKVCVYVYNVFKRSNNSLSHPKWRVLIHSFTLPQFFLIYLISTKRSTPPITDTPSKDFSNIIFVVVVSLCFPIHPFIRSFRLPTTPTPTTEWAFPFAMGTSLTHTRTNAHFVSLHILPWTKYPRLEINSNNYNKYKNKTIQKDDYYDYVYVFYDFISTLKKRQKRNSNDDDVNDDRTTERRIKETPGHRTMKSGKKSFIRSLFKSIVLNF